jgi:hypothetical protein
MKSVLGCLLLGFMALVTVSLIAYILFAAPIISAVTGTLAMGVEISALGWVLIGFALGLRFLFWAVESVVDMVMRIEYKPKKAKEPGVISAYLKARKEKYCPIIKVE